mgnify:CR=1 FL=1
MEDLTNPPKNSLIKKFDQSSFGLIDKFKTSPFYTSFIDFYSSLEDEKQKLMKASIIGFIFLLPGIFSVILLWSNHQLKKDLKTRIDLVDKANQIIEQKKALLNAGSTYLSSTSISKFSDLKNTISSVLSTLGVDLAKINVSSLDEQINNTEGKINSISASIKFSSISTNELMNIFINLIQREKLQVHQLSISRNKSNNLLFGSFNIVHLSMAQSEDFQNGL